MVPPGERTRRYRLSDMLTQWRRTTDIRKQDTKDRNLRISKGQNPYPVGDLRRGGLLKDQARRSPFRFAWADKGHSRFSTFVVARPWIS